MRNKGRIDAEDEGGSKKDLINEAAAANTEVEHSGSGAFKDTMFGSLSCHCVRKKKNHSSASCGEKNLEVPHLAWCAMCVYVKNECLAVFFRREIPDMCSALPIRPHSNKHSEVMSEFRSELDSFYWKCKTKKNKILLSILLVVKTTYRIAYIKPSNIYIIIYKSLFTSSFTKCSEPHTCNHGKQDVTIVTT